MGCCLYNLQIPICRDEYNGCFNVRYVTSFIDCEVMKSEEYLSKGVMSCRTLSCGTCGFGEQNTPVRYAYSAT